MNLLPLRTWLQIRGQLCPSYLWHRWPKCLHRPRQARCPFPLCRHILPFEPASSIFQLRPPILAASVSFNFIYQYGYTIETQGARLRFSLERRMDSWYILFSSWKQSRRLPQDLVFFLMRRLPFQLISWSQNFRIKCLKNSLYKMQYELARTVYFIWNLAIRYGERVSGT